MTSFTPSPKPKRAPPKKRSSITRQSEKQKASGKRFQFNSTISSGGSQGKKIGRNAKRQASEFQRCFHSKQRVQWVKSLPCIACLTVGRLDDCGPVENCHVTDDGTKGAGRRSGYACIVPMGRKHHVRFDRWLAPFDRYEEREWIQRHAERIEAAWQRFLGHSGASE